LFFSVQNRARGREKKDAFPGEIFFSGIKQFPEKKTGLFDVRNDTGQRQQQRMVWTHRSGLLICANVNN